MNSTLFAQKNQMTYSYYIWVHDHPADDLCSTFREKKVVKQS